MVESGGDSCKRAAVETPSELTQGVDAVKASEVGKPDLRRYQNPDLVLWCWGQPPSASSPCCLFFQLIEPQTLVIESFNMPKVEI